MERRKAWALAWLLAGTLSVLLLHASSARSDELLVNGDFEDGSTDPWKEWGGALEAVEGVGVDGSSAAVFSTDESHDHHWLGQCVSVVGEVDYQFSGWLAWPGEGQVPSAYLLMSWYGQADCYGEEVYPSHRSPTEPLVDAGSWYHLALDARAETLAARSARVSVVVPEESTTVYLDDFALTGPSPPTPTPSPTATETPQPTPSPSPSPSPSPEATPSPSPSPAPSPSATAVPPATKVPSTRTPPPSTATPSAALANGGFEEADAEGMPLAWRKYGGELARSSAAKWEGEFAAAFTSRTASTKWAFQTVAVEEGKGYVLSGYALKNDASIEATYLRLSWYATSDGSGSAIDSVDSTTQLTDDWPDFRFLTSGPVAAPAEAISAKVRLMIDPRSEAEGTVYFDAISFGETAISPQPEEPQQPSPSSGGDESPATPATLPAEPAGEGPPSSPAHELPPSSSPAVLSGAPTSPQATAAGRDESARGEVANEAISTRTPVSLYRERSAAEFTQGEEDVVAPGDNGDGFSTTVAILATAPAAVAAAAVAFFVWRRWERRSRPP